MPPNVRSLLASASRIHAACDSPVHFIASFLLFSHTNIHSLVHEFLHSLHRLDIQRFVRSLRGFNQVVHSLLAFVQSLHSFFRSAFIHSPSSFLARFGSFCFVCAVSPAFIGLLSSTACTARDELCFIFQPSSRT